MSKSSEEGSNQLLTDNLQCYDKLCVIIRLRDRNN